MSTSAPLQTATTRPAANPTGSGVLQRKCACGAGTSNLSGECEACGKKNAGLQRKLMIGVSNDPLEREADRVADQIMSTPAQSGLGNVAPRIQRHATQPDGAMGTAPASVESALSRPGRPLEPSLRQDMEQRFGHDFSRVRVHSDAHDGLSAREISAQAYAVGQDIVFGSGRYTPSTPEGRRLVAHELAHVVQQGGAEGSPTLRRKDGDDPLEDLGLGELGDLAKDLAKGAEEEVRKQLRAVGALPGTGALFKKSGCPSNFCNPFKDVSQAKTNLILTSPFLLAGVAKVVSPRVVPLWKDYLLGGSAPQDLTSSFATDFTASRTAATTANFIVSQLKKEIAANHAAIMGTAASVRVDLTPRMSKTLAAIDKQGNPNAMDFDVIGEIPGNIAGGIGKDQLANKIGAKPSPFNDDRTATVSATLTRTAKGVKVAPAITFKIRDTIDLCPGNCGALTEQDATIPMSRFEATGLSGDVPFSVEFPAPASALGEFEVPAPKAKPKVKPKSPAKPSSSKKKASLEQPLEQAEALAAISPLEESLEASDEPQMEGEEVKTDEDGEVPV